MTYPELEILEPADEISLLNMLAGKTVRISALEILVKMGLACDLKEDLTPRGRIVAKELKKIVATRPQTILKTKGAQTPIKMMDDFVEEEYDEDSFGMIED